MLIYVIDYGFMYDFPGDSVDKESARSAGNTGDAIWSLAQ